MILLSFNHNFLFLSWVQYWDILLSGETALIKYYIMNNVCKYVRHIFHKVKMNSFLVLPDVFVACINNIWSEWQNKRIHPFIPVIWCSVPLYPLAVVTGLCSFHPASLQWLSTINMSVNFFTQSLFLGKYFSSLSSRQCLMIWYNHFKATIICNVA